MNNNLLQSKKQSQQSGSNGFFQAKGAGTFFGASQAPSFFEGAPQTKQTDEGEKGAAQMKGNPQSKGGGGAPLVPLQTKKSNNNNGGGNLPSLSKLKMGGKEKGEEESQGEKPLLDKGKLKAGGAVGDAGSPPSDSGGGDSGGGAGNPAGGGGGGKKGLLSKKGGGVASKAGGKGAAPVADAGGAAPVAEGGGMADLAITGGGGDIAAYLRQLSQPAFEAGKQKIKTLGKNYKKTAPASKKKVESEKAAVAPSKEGQAKANDKHVKKNHQKAKPKTNKEKAKSDFRKKLQDSLPKKVKHVLDFKKSKKAKNIGKTVMGVIAVDKDKVMGTYQDMKSKPAAEPNAKSVPLPPMEKLTEAPQMNLGQNLIAPLKPEHTDFTEYNTKAEKAVTDQGITQQHLDLVDSGDLAEAKKSKSDLKDKAQKAPNEADKVRKEKVGALDQQLQQEEQKGRQAMLSERQKELDSIKDQQVKAKGTFEQERQKVTEHINNLYEGARSKVDQRLKNLEGDSFRKFEQGQNTATKKFEDNVDRRMKDLKKKRYKGFRGKLRWVKDKILGIGSVKEVKQLIDEERTTYVNTIDKLVEEINKHNEKVINECRQTIDDVKKKIDNYVDGLPSDLRAAGEKAEQDIDQKLKELEQKVDDKQMELQQKLAEKREEAIKAIDDKIAEMKKEMGGLLSKLVNLLLDAALKFLKWALQTAGLNPDPFINAVKNIASAIIKIIKNPLAFLKNLIKGVGGGFKLFGKNIKENLMKSIGPWLKQKLGLENANIEFPKKFDIKGVMKMVMSVLGVSWGSIKSMFAEQMGGDFISKIEGGAGLVKGVMESGPQALKSMGEDKVKEKMTEKLGAEKMGKMTMVVDLIRNVISDGPGALIDFVKDKASDLKGMAMDKLGGIKDMVMGGIKDWVKKNLIEKGIQKLVSFLAPAGGIVQGIISIYKSVKFFLDKRQELKQLVTTVISALGLIVDGNPSGAAVMIKDAIMMAIPLLLNFIMKLLNINGIFEAVKNAIQKTIGAVNAFIKKAVEWVAKIAKTVMDKVKGWYEDLKGKVTDAITGKKDDEIPDYGDPEKTEKVSKGLAKVDEEQQKYAQGGAITLEHANQAVQNVKASPEGAVFSKLEIFNNEDRWDIRWAASPTQVKTGLAKAEANDPTAAGANPEAVEKLANATPEQVNEALEYLARIGYFGEVQGEAGKEYDNGVTTSATGSANGGLTAEANASASAEIKDIAEGLKVVVELGAQAGVYGSLEGALAATYGPVGVKLAGNLDAYAVVKAVAEGSFSFSALKGLEAEGSAEAFAGAKAEGDASLNLNVGSYAFEPAVEGEAAAGAGAKAEGKLNIGLSGVKVEGEASAFAGATAEATITPIHFSYKGKTILKIEGEIGASAGAGAGAEGKFKFQNGVLKIGGGVLAALGLGGKVGFEGTLDVNTLGVAVVDTFKGLVTRAIGKSEESPEQTESLALMGAETAGTAEVLEICDSVGQGGVNEAKDVTLVQELLKKAGHNVDVDGVVGQQTIGAIKDFQKASFGWQNPDGRVDPNGTTWNGLVEAKSGQSGVTTDQQQQEQEENCNEEEICVEDNVTTEQEGSYNIIYASKVSSEFAKKVIDICKELGVNPNYLMAAMHFESGGTFSPSIKNAAGSGATGLIQFMPSTARGLGTTTADLAQMTAVDQLDYVKAYFIPYKGRLNSVEDVYMAILWPKAVGKTNDYVLFAEGSEAYRLNKGLDTNKDGNITKGEAAGKVSARYDAGAADVGTIHTETNTSSQENQQEQQQEQSGSGTSVIGNVSEIKGSVGEGGKNNEDDAILVQSLLKRAGLDIAVDGDVGPKTIGAIKAYQKKAFGWEDGKVDPGGKTFNSLVEGQVKLSPEDIIAWQEPESDLSASERPTYENITKVYGSVHNVETVMMNFPFSMKLYGGSTTVTRATVHKKVAKSLENALKAVQSHYGMEEIERLGINNYDGLFNKRKMRGSSKWSTHAWGIAIDLDASRNKLRWGADKAEFAKPEYQALLDIMESHGWYNLGRYKNYDYMHFQAVKP